MFIVSPTSYSKPCCESSDPSSSLWNRSCTHERVRAGHTEAHEAAVQRLSIRQTIAHTDTAANRQRAARITGIRIYRRRRPLPEQFRAGATPTMASVCKGLHQVRRVRPIQVNVLNSGFGVRARFAVATPKQARAANPTAPEPGPADIVSRRSLAEIVLVRRCMPTSHGHFDRSLSCSN